METLQNRDVVSTLKGGQSLSSKNIIFVYKKNNTDYPRFAFVVSRKFSKKAVERNRAKRLMREALRLYGNDLKGVGYDIILIPKKGLQNKKTYHLKEDIEKIAQWLKS
ncbi:MAG: ribonuclease P protein component [Aquificae bacterium]|nr:ribonuclease P protein component [Aquificota bacterium]